MKKIHQFSIVSKLAMIQPAVEESVTYINNILDDIDIFGFRLVLTEALNNAIIHGSKSPTSEVNVSIEIDHKESLRITVKDNGNGFNWEKHIESTDNFGQLVEGGRGIKIFTLYGYEVDYKNQGSTIHLLKSAVKKGVVNE